VDDVVVRQRLGGRAELIALAGAGDVQDLDFRVLETGGGVEEGFVDPLGPEDPPVTTSTGRSSRSPSSARKPALADSSLRSRPVISLGMGMPTRVEPGSSVSGKV